MFPRYQTIDMLWILSINAL